MLKGPVFTAETVDPAWKGLYRVGAMAALGMVAVYIIALLVYLPAYSRGPPPATVHEWLTLFQNEPITGLFLLGLADVLIDIAWIPVVLALFAALKHVDRSVMAVATAFAFVGMATFLATNVAFSMLSLSHEQAAATTDAQRTMIQASGQALIAIGEGTGLYTGALVWLAALIISVVMLRSNVFGKVTSWIGIVGFALLLVGIPFSTYTSVSPTGPGPIVTAIIAVQYVGGGLLSMFWYFLVGRRLFQLGSPGVKEHT